MVKSVEIVMAKTNYEIIRATEAMVASVAEIEIYEDMVVGGWEIKTVEDDQVIYYGSYDTKKAAEEDARGLRRSERKGA